jgi:hypothetical protein
MMARISATLAEWHPFLLHLQMALSVDKASVRDHKAGTMASPMGRTIGSGIEEAERAEERAHLLTIAEATIRYKTNLQTGLTSADAAERQKRDGKNVLSPPRTISLPLTFLRVCGPSPRGFPILA